MRDIRPGDQPGDRPGDTVGEIELSDQDGRLWRLSDQRGRPTLLILHRHLH